MPVSIDHLRRRYPRLCQRIKFRDNNFDEKTYIRSDIWMMKLMEDCYDEAMLSSCRKGSSKIKKVGGLDLGGMDSFPLVVQRFLAQTYSVLKVRERVCLEILIRYF
jgi:hypothetical protein